MPELAPICLSTYIRLEHLKKTIASLQENTLAQDSLLYIFSDAPRPGDEETVSEVRKYIHTIDGFREVNIVERETNGRVKNGRGGISFLLEKYGRCVFMEEDMVTAPGFLAFMNEAMDLYEDDKRIISVNGYTPPINIPSSYRGDGVLLGRFFGWGAGFWKHKYDLIQEYLDVDEYRKNIRDKKFFKKLTSNGHEIYVMLEKEIRGEVDALDVKIMYQQALNDWFVVSPRKSLVRNIGYDGTGVHCGTSDRYDIPELWDKEASFSLSKDLAPDQRVSSLTKKFYRYKLKIRAALLLKRVGLYELALSLKNLVTKIY